MTKVRTDRLRKLADHLMNKLPTGHTFNFGVLYEERKSPDSGYCGTVACALGELPFCFPEDWIIDVKGPPFEPLPFLRALSNDNSFDDAGDFFNLEGEQVQHLFMPCSQNWANTHPGIKRLVPNATAQQVGLNILYFCHLEEEGALDYSFV